MGPELVRRIRVLTVMASYASIYQGLPLRSQTGQPTGCCKAKEAHLGLGRCSKKNFLFSCSLLFLMNQQDGPLFFNQLLHFRYLVIVIVDPVPSAIGVTVAVPPLGVTVVSPLGVTVVVSPLVVTDVVAPSLVTDIPGFT